jgi:hypothetical protein
MKKKKNYFPDIIKKNEKAIRELQEEVLGTGNFTVSKKRKFKIILFKILFNLSIAIPTSIIVYFLIDLLK